MKKTNFEYGNVNYYNLSKVQLAWFRIMISIIMLVFVSAYIVFISNNDSLFVTVNNRIAMMFWAASGGMIMLGCALTFIDSWVMIRKIQEEELSSNTLLFTKKEYTDKKE